MNKKEKIREYFKNPENYKISDAIIAKKFNTTGAYVRQMRLQMTPLTPDNIQMKAVGADGISRPIFDYNTREEMMKLWEKINVDKQQGFVGRLFSRMEGKKVHVVKDIKQEALEDILMSAMDLVNEENSDPNEVAAWIIMKMDKFTEEWCRVRSI